MFNQTTDFHKHVPDEDWRRLPLLKAFQQCDLYSKGDAPPRVSRLLPHYRRLLDTYLPGELDW